MLCQWEPPNRLDCSVGLMGLIVFPTPSGIAQINPIGGLVTGAGKQAFVNKCLKILNDHRLKGGGFGLPTESRARD